MLQFLTIVWGKHLPEHPYDSLPGQPDGSDRSKSHLRAAVGTDGNSTGTDCSSYIK
jgi:hypothetical protein